MSDTETSTQKPPIRVWRLFFFTLAVLAAAAIVFFVTRHQIEKKRATSELALLEAQLDEEDPNWRLADLEQAREPVGDADNSALVAATVARMVPVSWPDHKLDDLLRDTGAVHVLDDEQAAALAREMKARANAAAVARRLADKPRGRHPLVWAEFPINTLLNAQQEVRRVAALLSYDSMHQAQEGDMDGALRSCRACVNAGRSLGDEPLMISQLIRIACIAVGSNAAERALAQGEASDKELALLQGLLAVEARHPTMLVAVRGERAMSYDIVSKMASGKYRGNAASLAGGPGDPEPSFWERLFSASISRREPIYNLRLMTRAVDAAKLPDAEQIDAEQRFEAEAAALGRDAILTKLLVPAVTKVGEACRRKTAQVRALMVLVAVERYRLKNKRWPEKLEDLGPDLLKAVPTDPYDGKPLRYKKLADGVAVYSIGKDLTDNGGNLNRGRPADPGTDQGFRLWDVKARRQPAKPRPPKPDEGEGVPPPPP